MEIIPAIDLRNGKCVRLTKGKKGTEKVYYENPLEALEFWESRNAKRIQFIDLDGAWGSKRNKKLLKEMLKKSKSKVQVGGGIRSISQAVELIDIGADRIIIGTLAIEDPTIIKILSKTIGSERIIVALDYKKGKIVTHGWTKLTDESPFNFGLNISNYGPGYILFSAVDVDGTLLGPDIENIKKIKNLIDIPIYAAGGIRDENDINNLDKLNIHGVVIGKAFYENKVDPSIIGRYK